MKTSTDIYSAKSAALSLGLRIIISLEGTRCVMDNAVENGQEFEILDQAVCISHRLIPLGKLTYKSNILSLPIGKLYSRLGSLSMTWKLV